MLMALHTLPDPLVGACVAGASVTTAACVIGEGVAGTIITGACVIGDRCVRTGTMRDVDGRDR
jgi:hypothetical protein